MQEILVGGRGGPERVPRTRWAKWTRSGRMARGRAIAAPTWSALESVTFPG